MKICFYANMIGSRHNNWREMFKKIEFYRNDIEILSDLGHEVIIAGGPKYLDLSADLYYCFWWGHAYLPMILAYVRNKPIIITGAFDYSTCIDEVPGLCYLDKPWWIKFILRMSLRLASANLFISKHEYDQVTSNLHVRNPILAPLSVNTRFYRPCFDNNAADPFFFSVSWLSKENILRKGVVKTFEAFASFIQKYPCVKLKLAGKSGDGEEYLKKLAQELKISENVEFLGMISDEEKIKNYHRCIAYVQPTLHEGFGAAIAEALSCGARVITSARGSVPEVASHFVEYVDPLSINEITDAMIKIITVEDDMERKIQACRWIDENYSIDKRSSLLEYIINKFDNKKG